MALPANPAGTALKGALARVADKLRPGAVYRREDLAQFSNAVDRHLRAANFGEATKTRAGALPRAEAIKVWPTTSIR